MYIAKIYCCFLLFSADKVSRRRTAARACYLATRTARCMTGVSSASVTLRTTTRSFSRSTWEATNPRWPLLACQGPWRQSCRAWRPYRTASRPRRKIPQRRNLSNLSGDQWPLCWTASSCSVLSPSHSPPF